MHKPPPRIYWDANAWIAYIRKEMPSSDNSIKVPRFDMCRAVLQRAQAREIEIVTSTFSLSEVCKRRSEAHDPAVNIAAFFDQPYVLLVDVTKPVGLKAQNLQLSGVGNIKPAATHLASALTANVTIFHTFDGGLLDLHKILTCNNGQQLQIFMPGKEVPTPELLRQMEDDGRA
jgi:predicted nucleic acid-binding protein